MDEFDPLLQSDFGYFAKLYPLILKVMNDIEQQRVGSSTNK
jgi:hypothetical protein